MDASVPVHLILDLFKKIFNDHPEAEVYFKMFDGRHDMPIRSAFDWVLSCIDHKRMSKTEFASEIDFFHLIM